MKKLLVSVAASLFFTGISAQKIAVISGKIDFLKNEKTLTVKFTYENMLVGKMTEADYVAKKVSEANAKEPGKGDAWQVAWLNDRTERFEPKFIELFNKYITDNNGATLSTQDGNKYVMTVNTHFTEPGFNVGVARKNSAVSLRVRITDAESGQEMAVITITNSSANDFMGTDFDVAYRIQESYAKAGRELARFFIRKLK